jgi:hypothetical protein
VTPLESLVFRYVSTHPNTRRKTVVDALGAEDWDTQKRVRNALDLLSSQEMLQRSGRSARDWRYAVHAQISS